MGEIIAFAMPAMIADAAATPLKPVSGSGGSLILNLSCWLFVSSTSTVA
jgi:hypothetical protein